MVPAMATPKIRYATISTRALLETKGSGKPYGAAFSFSS
jgi:hypothetical protein